MKNVTKAGIAIGIMAVFAFGMFACVATVSDAKSIDAPVINSNTEYASVGAEPWHMYYRSDVGSIIYTCHGDNDGSAGEIFISNGTQYEYDINYNPLGDNLYPYGITFEDDKKFVSTAFTNAYNPNFIVFDDPSMPLVYNKDINTNQVEIHGITKTSDGEKVFCLYDSGYIGVLDASETAISYMEIPSNKKPENIVADKFNTPNCYATLRNADAFAKYDGVGVAQVDIGIAFNSYWDLCFDDKYNLWATVTGGCLVKYDILNQTATAYTMPDIGCNPHGICFDGSRGTEGTIWFTEFEYYDSRIGRYDITSNSFNEYQLPDYYLPEDILVDNNGDVWFSASGVNKIVKLDTALPSFNVLIISPNGGEQLGADGETTIEWSATGNTGEVDIRVEYSTDGGLNYNLLVKDLSNIGYIPWSINHTLSDDCLVRIYATDDVETVMDTSNATFSIVPQPIGVRVVTPNGGEEWQAEQLETIIWSANGGFGEVLINIYYSYDAGLNWECLTIDDENDDEYTWGVNNTPSDTCLVKIVAHDEIAQEGMEVSGQFFSILPASIDITITAPEGGEILSPTNELEILWGAEGGIEPYTSTLFFSIDAMETFNIIVENYTDFMNYTWTVPTVDYTTEQCNIIIIVYGQSPALAPIFEYSIEVSENFTIYVEDETPEIPDQTDENGITIDYIAVGSWSEGTTETPQAEAGDMVIIVVEISGRTMDSVILLWFFQSGSSTEANTWQSVDMELVQGTTKYGEWQAEIPPQNEDGTLYYHVVAESKDGYKASTPVSTMVVSGSVSLDDTMLGLTVSAWLLIAIIIVVILGLAIFIKRKRY